MKNHIIFIYNLKINKWLVLKEFELKKIILTLNITTLLIIVNIFTYYNSATKDIKYYKYILWKL